MRWWLSAALLLPMPAAAEVLSSSPDAFVTEQAITIAVPPEAVWTRMGDIASWWDPAHSYSGRAGNLSLDLDAHGCFCERLPGERGSVEHAHIVHLDRPRLLRMSGALGPLQAEAAIGTLSFAFAPDGAGTRVTLTYVVGGNLRGKGVALAPAVDGVLAHQLGRLKAAAERR